MTHGKEKKNMHRKLRMLLRIFFNPILLAASLVWKKCKILLFLFVSFFALIILVRKKQIGATKFYLFRHLTP